MTRGALRRLAYSLTFQIEDPEVNPAARQAFAITQPNYANLPNRVKINKASGGQGIASNITLNDTYIGELRRLEAQEGGFFKEEVFCDSRTQDQEAQQEKVEAQHRGRDFTSEDEPAIEDGDNTLSRVSSSGSDPNQLPSNLMAFTNSAVRAHCRTGGPADQGHGTRAIFATANHQCIRDEINLLLDTIRKNNNILMIDH